MNEYMLYIEQKIGDIEHFWKFRCGTTAPHFPFGFFMRWI